MKSSTYKWIIGCLIGVIVILVAYLVVNENGLISVSFSECLSVAATITSLILSVIAMLYTYYSGRDTERIYEQIGVTITKVNNQVEIISNETQKNSKTLTQMINGIQDLQNAMATSTNALKTLEQENLTESDKHSVIQNIKSTNNSMLMFLDRMNRTNK